MLTLVQRFSGFPHTFSFFSNAITHCFSSTNPSNSLKPLHAQLIKLGLNAHTFLADGCIDLYFKSGSTNEALKAFHEIAHKETVSWNLHLKILAKSINIEVARQVFDTMPERDSVSWNTVISGYVSSGDSYRAWELFARMQREGFRPTGYTFSVLLPCVMCCDHAKEIHCYLMRNFGGGVSLVVWNSLIDAYGKSGLVGYALDVFLFMEEVDVISWNSLISACCQMGYERFGLRLFYVMGMMGYKPDGHTFSAVLHACSKLRNLEKGKQVVCLCVKMGILRNPIVSSAAIGMFSKCNRVEEATYVFENLRVFHSSPYNSMIACYASHYMEEKALEMLVLALRQNIRPTEFTLSCVLSSSTAFYPTVSGIQFHSLVIKLGFELDAVVASSLVDMYNKYGLVECSAIVFEDMGVRNLITWNTMLLGFTNHGKLVDAIRLFYKLLESGLLPDQITYTAVLLACSYGGFVQEGMAIFSSMTKQYGIKPLNEHYACVANIMNQSGETGEAIALLQEVLCEPDTHICESVLRACGDSGDLELIERLAERMMLLDAHSLLPCMVLANAYEKKGKWESVVRVRKEMMMKLRKKREAGCSWIGIQGCVFPFEGTQIVHHGGKEVYAVLQLLSEEMSDGIIDKL